MIPHHMTRRVSARILTTLLLIMLGMWGSVVSAHPLGNFTVNHFSRISIGAELIRLRYVVDMAEIPTFQESQAIDANQDGRLSSDELNAYLERVAPDYADGLLLTVDGTRVPAKLVAQHIALRQGTGGLSTLRVECDLEASVPSATDAQATRRLHFEDSNFAERIGWRELFVEAAAGVTIFDSNVFGSPVTDELKTYPQDMLVTPLNERTADVSWTRGAAIPNGSVGLRTRDGHPAAQARGDRFSELINEQELTPFVALLALLLAAGFGAMHAFSPGHGKTVVGAYLVGSRGTAKHAAFLGLTVTVTHTIGVIALGLITLFASHYILPERLVPVLALISGAIVLLMGLSLFVRRLRVAFNSAARVEHHHHDDDDVDAHTQEHGGLAPHAHEAHGHAHHQGDSTQPHTHGGSTHTHLPPGADGGAVTWRSLLALGVSGGLLPCPSALVVLLAAIAAGKVGYGLALVVAFSVGLAATLTAIGLIFVYAGRFISRSVGESRVLRLLPLMSALVIACLGAALCYEALGQTGFQLPAFIGNFFRPGGEAQDAAPQLASLGAFTVLGLGLVFGLKHATEVDHVIAVSTIVSEQRNVWRAALVGGMWGVGHTVSLVLVGGVVLALRIAIPERVANWLEFGVALMIIGLGLNAFIRALRGHAGVHAHPHKHGGVPHAHLHFHEDGMENVEADDAHRHVISRIGVKPLLVGAMHGLAGSAALTLLVLAQINSVALGLLYLTVFGVGSIVGMLLMSGLVGLPFALNARRVSGLSYGLQTLAGALSIAFGLWYAYETGIVGGLL